MSDLKEFIKFCFEDLHLNELREEESAKFADGTTVRYGNDLRVPQVLSSQGVAIIEDFFYGFPSGYHKCLTLYRDKNGSLLGARDDWRQYDLDQASEFESKLRTTQQFQYKLVDKKTRKPA